MLFVCLLDADQVVDKRKVDWCYIIVDKPSRGLIVLRWCCGSKPVAGVLLIDESFLGVICGVMGVSFLGLAMVDAPRARVWLLSRRRFGASLIFGCVWH